MKSSGGQKSTRKQAVFLFIILMFVGAATMLATLHFSVVASLNVCAKTLKRNISDLKKQRSDYDEFLAADEAKSLVRLTEQAEDIGETLALLSENEKKNYLDKFQESQRLDCLLILGENMTPDSALVSDRSNYEEWEGIFSERAISSVLSYPKNSYSARVVYAGQTYDIAAAAIQDAEGIVICAILQEDEKLATHYSPVRNLLATNETVLKGTLYIVEGGRVIATNRENGYSQASEIRELRALDAEREGDSLTKFNCGGETYYGGTAEYHDYTIYAFYPASAVFADSRGALLIAFCLYTTTAVAIVSVLYRIRATHDREISRQYEIIRSISHIYLLTVVVDMRNGRYTILKHPKKWGDVSPSGTADKGFFDKFLSYVAEEFREEYSAFMDPRTIQERLVAADHVEMDYQDVSGEWLTDKIIPQERDGNGEFHSYILVRKSIREQKKAEHENQERLKMAAWNEARANQSKTDFLRRMSHDIRTPINVILGMLEIAERNPTDKELLKDCRKKSKAAAEYLLDLVNEILTINRLDAGSTEEAESTAPFDLAAEIQKLYLVTKDRAGSSGITLEKPRFDGENRPLEGNALYLRQIMMNIVTNAVRYSRDGGIVRISVSEAPIPEKEGFAEVRFVCEDQGIGMSKEFQKKMFEPFSQEDAVGGGQYSGVGLGLSIVWKLVNKLGGQIRVDSEKNVGTRFEVILPVKYSDKPIDSAPERSKTISLEGLTVLLVEDNELNMEIAEYMLIDAGAGVIKAYNGKEAVRRFLDSAPGSIDAVITDMTMPVMDGLEATRQIRALDRPDAKTVPIIAMTANLFEQDRRACTDAGMTGFLPKPLNIGQMLAELSQQARRGGTEA